jgi:repressor LexA
MTQDELAKKMGYKSRSSINKIELGLTDIPQSKITAFARALHTTPAHLMGWDAPSKEYVENLSAGNVTPISEERKIAFKILLSGEPLEDALERLKTQGRSTESVISISCEYELLEKLEIVPPPHKKRIPILGRVSAGVPLAAVEDIEGYEWVDDASLDYGLIVKGDSMIGARICEGDIIFVDRDAEVSNGDIVVALINDDDTLIKRFYRYGEEIILRPENPTQTEQHYRVQEVQILGKVKEAKYRVR